MGFSIPRSLNFMVSFVNLEILKREKKKKAFPCSNGRYVYEACFYLYDVTSLGFNGASANTCIKPNPFPRSPQPFFSILPAWDSREMMPAITAGSIHNASPTLLMSTLYLFILPRSRSAIVLEARTPVMKTKRCLISGRRQTLPIGFAGSAASCALSILQVLRTWDYNHRIIESPRLERPTGSSSPTIHHHQWFSLNHVPQHNIQMFLQHLQGRWLHHLSGQPIPVPFHYSIIPLFHYCASVKESNPTKEWDSPQ